jgi:predicted RNA-binding Zn-ribbon protein involved in translation (DUF1610 family)
MAAHDCTEHLPSRLLARLGVEHTCPKCGKKWVVRLSKPNRNREWQPKGRLTLW